MITAHVCCHLSACYNSLMHCSWDFFLPQYYLIAYSCSSHDILGGFVQPAA